MGFFISSLTTKLQKMEEKKNNQQISKGWGQIIFAEEEL